MTAPTLIGMAATVWWVALVLARAGAVSSVFLHPRIRAAAPARTDRPPVSVVIPVAQSEVELEEALASAYAQDYGDFEVLITGADTDSAALDVARRVSQRHPDVPTRLLLGNPRTTLNPKMSNVEPALAAAAYDLVLVKDSNVRLPPGYLETMVRSLSPGVGLVCAVTVGVRPESFSADVECAMTNAHAAPWLLGGSLVDLDIGFGKAMLFDRRDLQRAGALAVMASTFGDDHALAKALRRIGLRTVFAPGVVHRVMAGRTLREVWDRQFRWMLIRRRESPLTFLVEPFTSATGATVAAALAGSGMGLPWKALALATFGLWLAGDALIVAAKRWGWSWRFPFACLCREALLLGLWLRAWTGRSVVWAGGRFDAPSGSGDAA